MLAIAATPMLAWLGSLIATAPMLGFMIYLAKANVSSTSRYMPVQLISALAGSLLVLTNPATIPALYALGVGLCGVTLYVFWYSRLNRATSDALQIGKQLPAFTLKNTDGKDVGLQQLQGTPALLLFYRGNWCPLCVTQVRELAGQYQKMAERGVQVCLISPQNQEETIKLAKRFDAPMQFLIDEGTQLAQALNIVHHDVVPPGLGVADPDSVYPTVVITDSDARIAWIDTSDNYRVRPDPAQYLPLIESFQRS